MSSTTFQRLIGQNLLTIETGRLAQQANGSAVVSYGESIVLATATMDKPREGIDFFPLTIDFEERMYARGKIPGNFFRREGRPTTDAILADRLTDRPLRPLFPKGFKNEVQIIVTSLSSDQEKPLDLLVVLGASAALTVSDIPFDGPIGVTRIGYLDGEYIVNPTYQQLADGKMDLVVAGSKAGVSMLEAGADELSEEAMQEGIRLGQEANLEVIALQEEMRNAVGKPKVVFETSEYPKELDSKVAATVDSRISDALDAREGKADQAERIKALKDEVRDELDGSYERSDVSEAFEALVEKQFRARVLVNGQRPDGRGLKDIRPVSSEVGILPRTHGSGLFNRGETQVLGVATLGSVGDAAKIDSLSPQESKRFLLHYNFPPFSTGEAGRVGSPKRRDIGHGALAERALLPVLPGEAEFPYTLRLVADVLSSNGSTSMGSVCACSLALMDAGVPIKTPVAGISIGLVTGDNGNFATLTDIQGMEDHAGDMDFKVAGTTNGITAIQLDIKIRSIGEEIIEAALSQAKEARLSLLSTMGEVIDAPRTDMSPYAPRMTRLSVPVEKIGALIGPGGKNIRGIVEETGATVDVDDEGTVIIGSADGAAAQRAIEMVEGYTKVVKVGDIYTGKVVRILDFGAFVQILPGTDGMVHISELADYRVPKVEDVVQEGEELTVIVIGVDSVSGKIALSRRALLESDKPPGDEPSKPGEAVGAQSQPDRPPNRSSGGYREGNDRPRGQGPPGGYRSGGRPRGGPRQGPRPQGGRPPRR